jgi:hypothetical protein
MAKLFIVPKGPIEQSEQQAETPETMGLSGDVKADTEKALRSLAFLLEFLDCMGPAALRSCADEVRAFRVQQ